jgi:hypothetical protein
MKQFLAVYTGSPESMKNSGWQNLSPAKRKEVEAEGMKAWGKWMETHKASILVEGGPLGKTIKTDAKGISNTTNSLCGYVVIKASSHEEAAQMFLNHPHFSIFPGEAVEILACLPVPIK